MFEIIGTRKLEDKITVMSTDYLSFDGYVYSLKLQTESSCTVLGLISINYVPLTD